MNEVFEIIKIVIPAAIVAYGSFAIIKSFLERQNNAELNQTKALIAKDLVPLRLQAYERLTIFLERISLNSLILRVNDPSFNARELHQLLIATIREEYNHNISQQIYVSQEIWDRVRSAVEETIGIINYAYQQVNRDQPAIELAKKIFDTVINEHRDPVSPVLELIREEVRKNF